MADIQTKPDDTRAVGAGSSWSSTTLIRVRLALLAASALCIIAWMNRSVIVSGGLFPLLYTLSLTDSWAEFTAYAVPVSLTSAGGLAVALDWDPVGEILFVGGLILYFAVAYVHTAREQHWPLPDAFR